MKTYYKDEDDLNQGYCDIKKCCQCDGTDQNGEPNGYGCPGQEKFIEKYWNSIISETNDNVKEFVSKAELINILKMKHKGSKEYYDETEDSQTHGCMLAYEEILEIVGGNI